MLDWDYSRAWYHGSPVVLATLRAGSTITQDADLARIFSHKPSLVSQDIDEQGRRIIKHTGTQPGYLYRIVEPVQPEDAYSHPATTMEAGQEWLTARELLVELIEPTVIVQEEILTEAEVAELYSRRNA